jgi:hypothetical protein
LKSEASLPQVVRNDSIKKSRGVLFRDLADDPRVKKVIIGHDLQGGARKGID